MAFTMGFKCNQHCAAVVLALVLTVYTAAGQSTLGAGTGTPTCDACESQHVPTPSWSELSDLSVRHNEDPTSIDATVAHTRRLSSGFAVVFALSDSLSSGSTTSKSVLTLTIGFATGSISGLATEDFDLVGCSLHSLSGAGNIYTATLVLAARTVVVTLPAQSVLPSPGNAANSLTLVYRTCPNEELSMLYGTNVVHCLFCDRTKRGIDGE